MINERISPEEFNTEMNIKDNIVIDVRTSEEHLQFWVLPKVDLYMNMHDNDFFEKLGKLDRTGKYFLYCWHANRTWYLLNYMKNIGFEYVKDLEGWIDFWEKSGLKLVKKI